MQLPEPARELLRGKAWGHVITLNAGGTPQVTMVWVDEEDGDLVFNTNMARQKAVNLQRDPRVTVSVQNVAEPQQYLLVRGQAELQTENAYDHINKLAHKFMDRDYPKNEGEVRVKVRVKADRVTGAGPWVQQA
jgi:PPOX class probable F420-dependent enzyme